MALFIRGRKLKTQGADRPQIHQWGGFIYPVAGAQRSAAQIDGAMSHLTGRLPPRCTQSHAAVSLHVLFQFQCHQKYITQRAQNSSLQHEPNIWEFYIFNTSHVMLKSKLHLLQIKLFSPYKDGLVNVHPDTEN